MRTGNYWPNRFRRLKQAKRKLPGPSNDRQSTMKASNQLTAPSGVADTKPQGEKKSDQNGGAGAGPGGARGAGDGERELFSALRAGELIPEDSARGARGIDPVGAPVTLDPLAVLGGARTSGAWPVPVAVGLDLLWPGAGWPGTDTDFIGRAIMAIAGGRAWAAQFAPEREREYFETLPAREPERVELDENGNPLVVWSLAVREPAPEQGVSVKRARRVRRKSPVLSIHSSGMAAKAARYVERSGGRVGSISSTSLDEACADAIGGGWEAWRTWSYVHGDVWTLPAERYVFGECWRAAHKSLTRNGGWTGRKAKGHVSAVKSEPLDADSVKIAAASVAAWSAANDGNWPEESIWHERRAGVRFVWRALVHSLPSCRGTAAATARRFARQRAKFVGGLVWGLSVHDSAARAGYASDRAAGEALKTGQVDSRLALAASKHWRKLPYFAGLLRDLRAAGLAAGAAVKANRAAAVLGSGAYGIAVAPGAPLGAQFAPVARAVPFIGTEVRAPVAPLPTVKFRVYSSLGARGRAELAGEVRAARDGVGAVHALTFAAQFAPVGSRVNQWRPVAHRRAVVCSGGGADVRAARAAVVVAQSLVHHARAAGRVRVAPGVQFTPSGVRAGRAGRGGSTYALRVAPGVARLMLAGALIDLRAAKSELRAVLRFHSAARRAGDAVTSLTITPTGSLHARPGGARARHLARRARFTIPLAAARDLMRPAQADVRLSKRVFESAVKVKELRSRVVARRPQFCQPVGVCGVHLAPVRGTWVYAPALQKLAVARRARIRAVLYARGRKAIVRRARAKQAADFSTALAGWRRTYLQRADSGSVAPVAPVESVESISPVARRARKSKRSGTVARKSSEVKPSAPFNPVWSEAIGPVWVRAGEPSAAVA